MVELNEYFLNIYSMAVSSAYSEIWLFLKLIICVSVFCSLIITYELLSIKFLKGWQKVVIFFSPLILGLTLLGTGYLFEDQLVNKFKGNYYKNEINVENAKLFLCRVDGSKPIFLEKTPKGYKKKVYFFSDGERSLIEFCFDRKESKDEEIINQ